MLPPQRVEACRECIHSLTRTLSVHRALFRRANPLHAPMSSNRLRWPRLAAASPPAHLLSCLSWRSCCHLPPPPSGSRRRCQGSPSAAAARTTPPFSPSSLMPACACSRPRSASRRRDLCCPSGLRQRPPGPAVPPSRRSVSRRLPERLCPLWCRWRLRFRCQSCQTRTRRKRGQHPCQSPHLGTQS